MRLFVRALLLLYVLLLVVVLFSPTSGTQSGLVVDVTEVLSDLGLPGSWTTFDRAEVALNAVIIAPVSFLGSVTFPRTRWQDWTAYAFLGAVTVELLQGLLLADRQASFSDIVANTAGASLGALLWLAVRLSLPRSTGTR